MNTLADKAITLWRSDKFRNWVMILLGNIARTIYGEAASVPSHVDRLALARRVLINPAQYVDPFVNATIGDTEVAPLGGVPEGEWTEAHLAALRSKIAELWTPIAVDTTRPSTGMGARGA